MKRILALAALLVLSLSPLSAEDNTAYNFKLADIMSTNIIELSQYQGKVVLVNFWATWCPPCRAEIPDMVKLQKKYKKDLVIIGVSLDRDGVDVVKKFAKSYQINYPIVMGDSELTLKYGGVRAIPTTFLVDQDGDIGKKIVGSRDFEAFEALVLPYLED